MQHNPPHRYLAALMLSRPLRFAAAMYTRWLPCCQLCSWIVATCTTQVTPSLAWPTRYACCLATSRTAAAMTISFLWLSLWQALNNG